MCAAGCAMTSRSQVRAFRQKRKPVPACNRDHRSCFYVNGLFAEMTVMIPTVRAKETIRKHSRNWGMNSIRRIALLLALIFLLPVISFSVYEFSSFSRDEKMIQTIYHKQLEAILFSVNQ